MSAVSDALIEYTATRSPDARDCDRYSCLSPATVRMLLCGAPAGDYCGPHYAMMRQSVTAHGHAMADTTGDFEDDLVRGCPGWSFGLLDGGRIAARRPVAGGHELMVSGWLIGEVRERVAEANRDQGWDA